MIGAEVFPFFSADAQARTRLGYRQSVVLPRAMHDVRRVPATVVQPVAPCRATLGSDRQVPPGNAAKTACNRHRSGLLAAPSSGGRRFV
jgi:hypothetical protein